MAGDRQQSISDLLIEIIPPERDDSRIGTRTCLCCERPRPASYMDDDGCGICEECLAP